jgi:two-component sensor histidine kinase
MHADVPVDQESPRKARRLLSAWLRGPPCSADTAADLVLAVSEAVTNCVEHAYLDGEHGTIRVDARIVTGVDERVRVVVTVADDGRWRPPPVDSGHRGRGLSMIAATLEDLHVDCGDSGTCVRMTSHPA